MKLQLRIWLCTRVLICELHRGFDVIGTMKPELPSQVPQGYEEIDIDEMSLTSKIKPEHGSVNLGLTDHALFNFSTIQDCACAKCCNVTRREAIRATYLDVLDAVSHRSRELPESRTLLACLFQ